MNARNLLFDVFKSERLAARRRNGLEELKPMSATPPYGTMTNDTFYDIGQ